MMSGLSATIKLLGEAPTLWSSNGMAPTGLWYPALILPMFMRQVNVKRPLYLRDLNIHQSKARETDSVGSQRERLLSGMMGIKCLIKVRRCICTQMPLWALGSNAWLVTDPFTFPRILLKSSCLLKSAACPLCQSATLRTDSRQLQAICLKLQKQIVFGRANFDVVRLRVLYRV